MRKSACCAAGAYQSTPHRVINADPARARVSLPFFYEPAFDAQA
jgi:isopenicillin N synthase-like dioxygenase